MNNRLQQQPVSIDLSKTTGLACDSCTNDTFIPVFYLRLASRFMVGGSQDATVPVQAFACSKCGHVNDSFNVNKNLLQGEVDE